MPPKKVTEADGTYRKNYQKARDSPNNLYFTPNYAMEFIEDYIKDFKRVWEPCCGEGHIVRYLTDRGHSVVGTDITMGDQYDIMTYTLPPDSYDILVTNPPFQGKKQTLERLFAFGKPFAVLMPTLSLDSNPFRAVLKAHWDDFGLLMPNRTINYIPSHIDAASDATQPPASSRSFFHSSWFCYKIPGVTGMMIV